MKLAPIVLFVYNRLNHTKETLTALKNNELAKQSKLIIYSDGAKTSMDFDKVQEVRNYIKTVNGFDSVKIIERETNLGLAKSIIGGVTEVIKKYGSVIVLEDDLITTKDFLTYMNKGLEAHKANKQIYSITGSNYLNNIPSDYKEDTFLFYRACSWGWATWEDRWNKVDWEVKKFSKFIHNRQEVKKFNRGGDDLSDTLTAYMKGKINVWAIRWSFCHYENNAFCLYPVTSKIENIGFDGSGIHCNETTNSFIMNSKLCDVHFSQNIQLDKGVAQNFHELHKYNYKNKIKQLIKRLIGYYNV